ncbi:MAG: pimeloyl-[acyl-carrier protein] methyl ester esterase [Nitrosomonadaceae bacterium]|nr:pimeloyl-[acyl-carrier protein] methyl ester esterase [Nitrosomonadaceae bacterium]|tara:strand:- start:528 stop:1304 length:777 start_codon:yes stop_codon:yes gene_type:complete
MRKIHIETQGEGPDFVLLHGWGMHSGIWDCIRSELAQHFRLHLVDLPGHGSSPTPWLQGPNSLKNMTEMIGENLPEHSIICGWSIGGQIAMKLSLDLAEKIDKLILVSTTPSFIQRGDWIWAMEKNILESFMKNFDLDYVSALNRFLTLQIQGDINTIFLLRKLRKFISREHKLDENGLKIGLEIILTADLRRNIKNINHPVTLLHGKNDAIVPLEAAKWLYDNLGNSELIILPDCGHIPFLSHTDQFLSSIFEATRI